VGGRLPAVPLSGRAGDERAADHRGRRPETADAVGTWSCADDLAAGAPAAGGRPGPGAARTAGPGARAGRSAAGLAAARLDARVHHLLRRLALRRVALAGPAAAGRHRGVLLRFADQLGEVRPIRRGLHDAARRAVVHPLEAADLPEAGPGPG